jgi:Rrf2 family nitric oxide-sensitive transcriptional repressor
MRLTSHTDYAFRLLTYVSLKNGEKSTVREVAEAHDISRNHLMKVAHQLQKVGYLATVRGKGGGLTLARAPTEIRLGEVVRDMEPDLLVAECFGSGNQCVITPDCRLRHHLASALTSFIDTLNEHTLADLVQSGRHAASLRSHLNLIHL